MAMTSPLPLLLLLVVLAPSPTHSSNASIASPSILGEVPSWEPRGTQARGLPAPPPSLLQEVVAAISSRERWGAAAGASVSRIDVAGARVSMARGYELQARMGPDAAGTARFGDDESTVEWLRLQAPESLPALVVVEEDGVVVDVLAGSGAMSFGARGMGEFEVSGPVEISVFEGADGRITLWLPGLKEPYTGLTRVHVAEGIVVKIAGAQQISFTHPYDVGLLPNGSLVAHNQYSYKAWLPGCSTCNQLISVQVTGKVVIRANVTETPGVLITSSFEGDYSAELLADKCFIHAAERLISKCLFCSVSPRLMLLDKVLRTYLGKGTMQNNLVRFKQAKVNLRTLVRFHLEVQRNILEDDEVWRNVSEWRTKPKVESIWLEVIANVKEGGRLKALVVKKLKRQFPVVESTAWSSLTSNVSFTQFPSFVVYPEALTLDVKW